MSSEMQDASASNTVAGFEIIENEGEGRFIQYDGNRVKVQSKNGRPAENLYVLADAAYEEDISNPHGFRSVINARERLENKGVLYEGEIVDERIHNFVREYATKCDIFDLPDDVTGGSSLPNREFRRQVAESVKEEDGEVLARDIAETVETHPVQVGRVFSYWDEEYVEEGTIRVTSGTPIRWDSDKAEIASAEDLLEE